MKTTPSSTRNDEIAKKVAAFIYEQVRANGNIKGWLALRWIELTIADSYAPLYEQKEELVRVLRDFVAAYKAWGVGGMGKLEYDDVLREAEAALEKAGA